MFASLREKRSAKLEAFTVIGVVSFFEEIKHAKVSFFESRIFLRCSYDDEYYAPDRYTRKTAADGQPKPGITLESDDDDVRGGSEC